MPEKDAVGKILIVDDNEANVRLLDVYLKNEGYVTEKAFDGLQALEKIHSTNPDLVLLDVMMPKLDGYEVCRRIRSNDDINVIPVVMITALTSIDDRVRGLECGADDFVSKPFDKTELMARVRNLLRMKYYRSMIAERQKFDAVIEDLATGIIVADGDHQTSVVNHEAAHLLGHLGRDCLGRDLFELFGGFRVRPSVDVLRAAGEHIVSVELAKENVSPGVYLHGRLTNLYEPSGKLANVAFVFRDVSDERRMEKLQRDFLSLMSHKLKTPTTIVDGYLKLITSGKYGELPEPMRRAFGLVESRLGDLKLLIEKLLQYASLSAEELRHEAVILELPDVVARAVERVATRYGRERIQIAIDIPDDLPRLRADVEQLALVLDNLLDNAAKFTPGELVRIEVHGRIGAKGMVEVAIRDYGPGIPFKYQADIFSDFSQVDEGFTGNVRGLGLGLPTAKRLVESWGGTITVESRPGEGSSFLFTVPSVISIENLPPPPTGGPGGHMETA
jgi:signal transduction histidine kinase